MQQQLKILKKINKEKTKETKKTKQNVINLKSILAKLIIKSNIYFHLLLHANCVRVQRPKVVRGNTVKNSLKANCLGQMASRRERNHSTAVWQAS